MLQLMWVKSAEVVEFGTQFRAVSCFVGHTLDGSVTSVMKQVSTIKVGNKEIAKATYYVGSNPNAMTEAQAIKVWERS